jgi:Bacterial SH3 domain
MIRASRIRRRLAAVAAAGVAAGGVGSLAAPALASAAPAASSRAQAATATAAAHVYRTQATGLRVRARATTKSRVLGVLGKAGSKVTVNCYVLGQPIVGDAVWYHITKPKTGYVAGFYLNTGRDPAAGIVRC